MTLVTTIAVNILASDTYGEGHGEALDGAGAELEQHGGGDQRWLRWSPES